MTEAPKSLDPAAVRIQRADVIALVERTQLALQLAQRDEGLFQDRLRELAARVDELSEAAQGQPMNSQAAFQAQADLDAARFELKKEQDEGQQVLRRRQDAQAALFDAERARDKFVHETELAGAPGRLEDVIGKLHALLIALAAAAVAAGLKIGASSNSRLAVGLAIAASVMGLLTYVPAFVAGAVDARRSRRNKGNSRSLVIAWYSRLQRIRTWCLIVISGLVAGAWVSLLFQFFTHPGG